MDFDTEGHLTPYERWAKKHPLWDGDAMTDHGKKVFGANWRQIQEQRTKAADHEKT